ncbi:AraC family transcriptional regulator [bacterium]|nr:AraC family transcriptional regulator [bacterium]
MSDGSSANRLRAMAVASLLDAHDQYVLHPDMYVPDTRVHGSFIPGPASVGHVTAPDEIHHATLTTDRSLPFEVQMAGRSEWHRGDRYVRRNVPSFSIELVTHGSGELVVGRKRYDLRPDDVFILHPNERHVYRACSREPFRKLFIVYMAVDDWHRRALEFTGLQDVSRIRLAPADARTVQAVMERIIDAVRDAPPDGPLAASLSAYELTATLARIRGRHEDARRLASRIETVVRYTLDHLGERLTIARLARVVNISPDHLNRLFIRSLGIRAHEWLLKLRIRVASEMLCKMPWKVHEVADSVGYDNAFAFTRAFKRVAGITPRAYRRLAWKMR